MNSTHFPQRPWERCLWEAHGPAPAVVRSPGAWPANTDILTVMKRVRYYEPEFRTGRYDSKSSPARSHTILRAALARRAERSITTQSCLQRLAYRFQPSSQLTDRRLLSLPSYPRDVHPPASNPEGPISLCHRPLVVVPGLSGSPPRVLNRRLRHAA